MRIKMRQKFFCHSNVKHPNGGGAGEERRGEENSSVFSVIQVG